MASPSTSAIKADKTGNYRSDIAELLRQPFLARLLFLSKFAEALQDAQKGLTIDGSQKWIITNLAHAHLFMGNVTLARQLYGIYANVKMNGRLFSTYVREDFDSLKRAGVTDPHMDEILHALDVIAAKEPAESGSASPVPSQSPTTSRNRRSSFPSPSQGKAVRWNRGAGTDDLCRRNPTGSFASKLKNMLLFAMTTLAEIEAALPKLTPEELMRVEAALHKLQRERKVGIIFDDAYGVWTEDDQASLAAEAWQILDGKPGAK